MKEKAKAQSVEPQIADLALGWLKQYKLKYYIEQDAPNETIKNALWVAIRGSRIVIG